MSEATARRRRGRPRKDADTGDTLPKPPPAEPTAAEPKAPKEPKEPKSAARGAGRPSARDKLEQHLAEQLGAIALTVTLFHPGDGQAIMRRAPECAHQLARLADQNPRVRRLLESGMTSSAWLGVAIAFGGLAMEIGANHGALPAWFAGKPEPAPAGDVFGNLAHLFERDAKSAHPSSNGTAP